MKKIAQAHVMIFRGALVEGIKVLRKSMQTAERFELVGEKLQMNHLLRECLISSATSEELKLLNEEITNDFQRYEALLYVEEQSMLLSSPEMSKTLKGKNNEKKYVELISSLGQLYKKHKLARIGFWYYMAATEYGTSRKDFNSVVELGLKFLKLVEKNPAVRSKNNIAGVNQTVGFAQMELRNFNEATNHLSKSEKFFPAAGFNRLQCLQFLVQAQLASGNYCGAEETISLALSHPRIAAREHLLPRWIYINGCAQFLHSDMSASFKSLNAEGYLLKQQDTWNMQFRLLEMMLLVEMKDEEWLEFKLDTTRKFVTRHKELGTLRVQAALDILGNLLRKELNFDELSPKSLTALKNCLDETEGYAWDPGGPEIVRLDKWVERKMSPSIYPADE
ncbi:MAG: hypothetical protein K9J17_06435 [Flavobacteriales bacterium]|nr:hypothetical protein [Flavobacteriales bacterium]